jgi:hypothetical protein
VPGKYSATLDGGFVVFVIGIYVAPGLGPWRRWAAVRAAGAAMAAIVR